MHYNGIPLCTHIYIYRTVGVCCYRLQGALAFLERYGLMQFGMYKNGLYIRINVHNMYILSLWNFHNNNVPSLQPYFSGEQIVCANKCDFTGAGGKCNVKIHWPKLWQTQTCFEINMLLIMFGILQCGKGIQESLWIGAYSVYISQKTYLLKFEIGNQKL